MSGLLGPNGKPISSVQMKKDPPPKLGEAFAPWAGRDLEFMQLPGGGVIQFDLSKLRLEDYRTMRDHYQVNSSLAVLSFMQHQADWHVECEDKKIADACETMLREIWTGLNRSLGTANWAGFSPNALDWENIYDRRTTEITKVKDLAPEECIVNWKEVEGWAPPGRIVKPKFKVYDGIKYAAQPWPIPVENSFWYPLLMENGDYYGKKLLRPAFQSWFFSILIHLFANRYFERFGEPTPIGRAPFDEELDVVNNQGQNQKVRGNQYLLGVINQLRNRSAVVLPNDKSQLKDNTFEYDYTLEYMESQMRGADFERYLTRLDEEISLGMFTPILLMRTADVGSYNLGVGHMQVYLWMLNAMNDDRATYINKYILSKFTNYNFSPKAPRPKMVYRKLGNTDTDMIKQLLVALINHDKVNVDLDELGKMAGLTLKQVRQSTKPDPAPADPNAAPAADPSTTDNVLPETKNVLFSIENRVRPQVTNIFRDSKFGPDANVALGYKRAFRTALEEDGAINASLLTDDFYNRIDHWMKDMLTVGYKDFSGPEPFMGYFLKVMDFEFDRVKSNAIVSS